ISIDFIKEDINNSINKVLKIGKIEKDVDFGDGNSDKKFYELLQNENFWHISNQKQFKDLY
ncbi:UDP-N-acetylglucosamine 2-epimerase (hydrolyzing), partial [Aliarcobacter butzleri]